MSSPRTVRVDIRSHKLAEAAEIQDTETGSFFALPEPPPVRSILAVHDGDQLQAFEVTQVVEVESDGQRCGVYAQAVDTSALDKSAREVGTEHLSPPSGESSDTQGSDGQQMAVPAPVVHPEASEQINVDQVRHLEENSANDTADGESSDEGSDADGPRRGKRRKSRKRR